MRVLYYSAGLTGSGHIVLGISINNAFKRRGLKADFLILHNNPVFAPLAERVGVRHQQLPFEREDSLSPKSYEHSALYSAILEIKPDILIVDQFWFMLHGFLSELACRKIFLCRQVTEATFLFSNEWGEFSFDPQQYDLTLAIEPFPTRQVLRQIEPLVIRNREEILPREKARMLLELEPSRPACLFSFNGKPGELEEARKMYSYLGEEGYQVRYSSNFHGGLFPAVDYFNAFDLLVCGAGYNSFWEAIFFQIESIFIPKPRRFEDQRGRVARCQEYIFQANGADELVELVLAL